MKIELSLTVTPSIYEKRDMNLGKKTQEKKPLNN